MALDLDAAPGTGTSVIAASATRVELLRRRLHARLLGEERLARLGRFEVLRPLGSGGMGAVFVGHDPQLRRRVALKLLRTDAPTDTLSREARVLARLAHPGIVEVYDVGRENDRAFVAMELVEGQTLAAWLRSKPPRTEIVRAFIAAGQALAAAHRAGIVHGDFKPTNVLRTPRGRIKVIDFGLSRVVRASSTTTAPDRSALEASSAAGGTMGFVAPEKLRGEPETPRSDQFSFCVTVALALCGALPFDATDAAAFSARVAEGPHWPRRLRLPAALRRALERGLALDPDARWPSMQALLARLEPLAEARRPWPYYAAAAVTIAGVVAWTTTPSAAVPGLADCDRADHGVRALWSDARRRDLERAMTAASSTTASRTADRIAAYAEDIAGMRRVACGATATDEAHDDALVDARTTCLDEREQALADLLAGHDEGLDARTAADLTRRAHTLPRVELCDDAAYLRAAIPPPASAEQRTEVDALTRRLDTLKKDFRARDHAAGVPRAEQLLREAEALGYAPLVVRAHNDLGVMHQLAGRMADARTHFEAAYFGAREHRMEVQALKTASNLVGLCDDEGAYDEALRWERHAAALLDDAPDPVVASKLHHNVAIVLQKLGRNDEARRRLERSLAIRREHLGPDHPITINAVFELGTVAMAEGRLDDATAAFEQTLRGWGAAFGDDHPDLANAHNNLGNVLAMQDRPEQAREHYGRAIALREKALGQDHPALGGALANLARVQSTLKEHAAARAAVERSLAIRRAALGDTHPAVASSWTVAGQIAHADGRLEDAATLLADALQAWAHTYDDAHPSVRETLLDAGEVALAMQRLDDACRYAQRVLEAATDDEASADARWLLARASHRRRPQHARTMAGAAAQALRGARRTDDAEEIERWLATHAR